MAGSGGAVGARHVYNSAPDGYTVLFSHTAFFVNRAVGLLDFGIEDLETIAVIGRNAGNVILVNANSPYRTLRELVEASRTASPALTFAVDFGATTHVMGVSVNRAGGRFNLVDLGGAPQRATALMGGHVTAIPNAVGTAVPFLESGEFRALAIIEDERNSFAPNIPTAVEQGYDVVFPMYYFFAFPRGTPREIVERFANACEQISRMPEYQRSIGDTFLQRPYFAKLDAARQVLERQQTEIYAMREILLAR
jgi:tripartite-type tricarboxylate transporter receptor subunit TctC